MKESSKARDRRLGDPFWCEVFRGEGLDIGAGDDPFLSDWFPNVSTVDAFDREDGDAQVITQHVTRQYDFVHSSNCLEHMAEPAHALQQWFSLVKDGGYLVITVPDEDLYEQGIWPSRWNEGHQWSFTVFKTDSWCSRSLNMVELVAQLRGAQLLRLQLADTGYDYGKRGVDQTYHGPVEAFIEVVIRKQHRQNPTARTYRHSGARGDIIYSLPTVAALGGGVLYVNLSATAYVGKPMDQDDLTMLRELLAPVPYIQDVREWKGECVAYDLDEFRCRDLDSNLLSASHLDHFGAKFDLSRPWIDPACVEPLHEADIVVTRSPRYHGPFHWEIMRPWQERCVFVGFQTEHEDFCRVTGLDMRFVQPESYLHIARLIRGSKLFVGNQSFPYSLAEAMKHPRVLEVCPKCPNCNPQSENGYTALTEAVLRYHVDGKGYPPSNPPDARRSHSPWFVANIAAKKKPRRVETERPRLSVILPHRNLPDDKLADTVAMLLSGADGIEVTVTAWGFSPVLRDRLMSLSPSPILIDVPDSICRAANVVAAMCSGDHICVVREDIIVGTGWADEFLAEFNRPKVGLVGIEMDPAWYPHLVGPCLGVSRDAYERLGLFNPAMSAGPLNEVELFLRVLRSGLRCREATVRAMWCNGRTVMLDGTDADFQVNAAYIGSRYGVQVS